MPQVTYNLNALDDEVIGDGTPSFDGGMVSNQRANLLEANQSSSLVNCDIDRFGKIRTRRGTIKLGGLPGGTGTHIQGLTWYQNDTDNYLVAANNGRLYKWGSGVWTQIATGGVQDDDEITFVRTGAINHAGGYTVGDTGLTVDGFTGVGGVACTLYAGQKLYFSYALKNDYYEYTIASSALTGNDTTTITLEEPGLVHLVYDNWPILVKQTARINHVGGYAGGVTAMDIDGYIGVVKVGEHFDIEHENRPHVVTGFTPPGANTTHIEFTGTPILGAFVAGSVTDPIIFAQGVDKLFWTAGGSIYAWDGVHTSNLDYASILDRAAALSDGTPPNNSHWITWFQNRLIAGALEDQLDTIYFSDFLDPTTWSAEFQSTIVGGGESDPVVAMIAWTDLNLVIFKQHSIYVVNCDPSQNPNPDDISQLVANFAIKLINRNCGCPAPRTAVMIGGGGTVGQAGDIFFLSDSGVRSVKRVIAAESQTEIGEPLSAPVQDIINRINRTYIDRSVAFYHESRYFLAIPVDDATEPNYVLVYNTILQRWIGQWSGWFPSAFAQEPMAGGVPRMVIGNSNGVVMAWLDDVREIDEVDATYQDFDSAAIGTRIRTRGYTLGDMFCPKTGFNCELEFDSSVATVNVQPILDGTPVEGGTIEPIDTFTGTPLILPFILDDTAILPTAGILRWAFDLQQYGRWRELQLYLSTEEGKLQIRSIRLTAFYDSLVLQTVQT